jgi:hypothetical protein
VSVSENEDVGALQARIEELQSQLETERTRKESSMEEAQRHHPRGLSVLAGILVVLACVLAPLSVTSVWANRIVSDTDQYVKTVAPLADNPEVQAVLTDEVTQAVLDNVDVQGVTHDALGALASQRDLRPAVAAALPGLEGALVQGIENFVHDQVASFIASDQFAQLWDEVNRVAHAQVVRLLSGNTSGVVTTQGDSVTLNLAPIIEQVKSALVAKGFTLASSIPQVNRSFVLMQSSSITKALLRGCLGLAGAMVVLGVGLAVMRTWYVDTTPGNVLSSSAAGDVFDTLVRFLRTALRAVGVLALVLAFTAFVSGPSPSALRTRRSFTHGIGSLRGSAEAAGWQTGRVGTWTYTHRKALRWTVAGLGGLVLVLWSQPTAWVVLVIALVVLLLLAVIEFVGRPTQAHT